MLVRYVHTTTFILAVIGLIGCAGRFDYNLLLALGWIYLSDKHPSFSKSFAVIPPISSFTSCCWGRSSWISLQYSPLRTKPTDSRLCSYPFWRLSQRQPYSAFQFIMGEEANRLAKMRNINKNDNHNIYIAFLMSSKPAEGRLMTLLYL